MATKETEHRPRSAANYLIAPIPAPLGAEAERQSLTSAFDEISKKEVKGGDLNRHLYEFRPLSQTEVETIRSLLTAWANSIPHHQLESFGDKIEILSGTYSPSFMARLATMYESRSVSRESQPYQGGHVPIVKTNEANIRLWAYPLPVPDDIARAKDAFLISDSQSVRECQPCNASGLVACGTCSGKGTLQCAACRSSGHVPCGICYGVGVVSVPKTTQRHENVTEYRTVIKLDHNRAPYEAREPYNAVRVRDDVVTLRETCTNCGGNGAVACGNCRGNGSVTCINCGGGGNEKCGSCDGKGKHLDFLVLVDSFRPAELTSFRHNPEIPMEVTDELKADSDFRRIASMRGKTIDPDYCENLQNLSVKSLLKSALADGLADAMPGEKICIQSLQILRADVVIIRYRFDGRDYDVLYPFTGLREVVKVWAVPRNGC